MCYACQIKYTVKHILIECTDPVLCSHIQLYLYIYKYTNISGNIVNNNDDFNKQRNTLLYKNISHILFSKGLMLVVCERWAGDGDRLLYWPSSTSFLYWLGCSTVGHWRPKALCLPLALNSASCHQLTPTVCAPGDIIDYRPHTSAVLPLIYTGASLDWRSVRGSIYNNHPNFLFKIPHVEIFFTSVSIPLTQTFYK